MTQNEAAPAGARNGTDAGTDEPSRKGSGDEAPWPEIILLKSVLELFH